MSLEGDTLARTVDVVGGERRMMRDLFSLEKDFYAVVDREFADELLAEEGVEGLLLGSLGDERE